MKIKGDELLKIGEVANQSGLSIQTIRYYDQLGLLSPGVTRTQSGYRLFEPKVINRLEFIRKIQTLGLSLQEIKIILDVHDSGDVPCGKIKDYLLKQLDNIEEQINNLNSVKDQLQLILSDWQELTAPDEESQTICPNIK